MNPRRLVSFLDDWIPPVAMRLIRQFKNGARIPTSPIDQFYASLVQPGCLCFDIGAHHGARSTALLRLGCRVVALEPQPDCAELLRRLPDLAVVQKAVGSAVGSAEMLVSDSSQVSSLDADFTKLVQASGRFLDVKWDSKINVDVTTLDELIRQFGRPDFTKIDVEGFEPQVLQGLSTPLPLLSLEWTPEATGRMAACVDHLEQLGNYEYNLTWGESMRMARKEWMSRKALFRILDVFLEENYLFGDVFARLI